MRSTSMLRLRMCASAAGHDPVVVLLREIRDLLERQVLATECLAGEAGWTVGLPVRTSSEAPQEAGSVLPGQQSGPAAA